MRWKTSPSWLVPPVLDDFMLLSPSVHCAKQWLAMWHDCLCTLGFFDRILFVYKWGFFQREHFQKSEYVIFANIVDVSRHCLGKVIKR